MEKHWHGAGPTTAMTHIAIVERLDGKAVDWMEKVSDEERLKDGHGQPSRADPSGRRRVARAAQDRPDRPGFCATPPASTTARAPLISG
jgi:hypothetical protein